MFEGAAPLLFEMARDLRKNMTEAERILWMHLREGINGLKFRRQHPIGIYIADFYCHKVKLIIEAEGLIHAGVKESDEVRNENLKKWGYHVLHFSNIEILNSVETVLEEIKTKIEEIFQSSIINQKTKSPL